MALDHATAFKTPTASDAALSEVVRRLVEAYRPERIYLFGSVARGDAGPDSDYDIMVVVPDDDAGATIEISGKIEEKLDDNRVVLALTARAGGSKVLTRARAVVRLP